MQHGEGEYIINIPGDVGVEDDGNRGRLQMGRKEEGNQGNDGKKFHSAMIGLVLARDINMNHYS